MATDGIIFMKTTIMRIKLGHRKIYRYRHTGTAVPVASVAEPEPVEPKLFGTWSRSRSRN